MWTLNRGGPKSAIITASIFILLGNWIRYGATVVGQSGNFGAVMFGQVLSGIAQPFVLAAPTTYSDLWFTSDGRVAATAVMTLANPLGGALAQLVNPFWTNTPDDIPNMVLYIAIIVSVPLPSNSSVHSSDQSSSHLSQQYLLSSSTLNRQPRFLPLLSTQNSPSCHP